MKRILIANAVPTNNGDAALVFGIYNKLVKLGHDLTISTMKYHTVKELYKGINWIESEYELKGVVGKILYRLPKVRRLYFKYLMNKNKEFYKDIDIIISAPGGYINSYYGIEDRLYCLNYIKKMANCKIIMYSQSVGPLNEHDKKVLDKYIDIFDLFMVRDEVSYTNVKQYNNVIKTNDAAFLLDPNFSYSNKKRRIGVSVREWSFDGRNKTQYIQLIKQMVEYCVSLGYEVEFISTCQGLKDYIDDSKIAQEIKSSLSNDISSKVFVNDNYYSIDVLRNYISTNFDAIIGTRLHMCILSTLAGVPAFNISYEIKGKECYKILGLANYSIDYNDNICNSMVKFKEFINNSASLKEVYKEKAIEMNIEANRYFDYMVNNFIEDK